MAVYLILHLIPPFLLNPKCTLNSNRIKLIPCRVLFENKDHLAAQVTCKNSAFESTGIPLSSLPRTEDFLSGNNVS